MIIVHDTFICKPGNASKLATLFKDAMSGLDKITVMTDVTGQFNKVLLISEFENLAAYEKMWEDMDPAIAKKVQDAMKGYTELYQTGSREIFKVW